MTDELLETPDDDGTLDGPPYDGGAEPAMDVELLGILGAL